MNPDEIIYKYGKLTSVKKHYDSFEDSSDMVCAYQLVFEHGEIFHEALPNTDEISIANSLREKCSIVKDVSSESIWNQAISCSAKWIWKLINQQGYHDGIQYEFWDDSKPKVTIQLMVEASNINVLKIKKL